MSGDAVSEAVAAAFGRSTGADGVSDAVAEAFGHPTVAHGSLVADLVTAGYTESGARGVVARLDAGFSAQLALAGSGFESDAVRVSERVKEAGAGVLARHGRAEVAEVAREGAGLSPAVAEARHRLLSAYARTSKGGPAVATEYADAAVKACLESGARQGWSESQVVEALERQKSTVLARVTEVRR